MSKFFISVIYVKELKNYVKFLIGWLLGLSFYLLAGMSKYQGYAAAGESLQDVFKGFPKEFMAFLGGSQMDFRQAGDFYAVAVMYMGVMLAIYAILLGSRLIGKEETDKTAEFLYSKPIYKDQAWMSKVLAGLSNLVVLNILVMILSLPIISLFNEGSSADDTVLLLAPSLFLIQIFFFALSVFLSSVLNKPKRSASIAGVVLLVTFVMSAMVDISDKFEYLKYLTPFKFFDPKVIYVDNGYNLIYVIVTVLLVATMLMVGRYVYEKRDLDI